MKRVALFPLRNHLDSILLPALLAAGLLISLGATAQQDPPGMSYCGQRSLWYAAKLMGIDIALNEVVDSCSTTLSGTSMLDLKEAARKLGFRARGARLTIDDLLELEFPTILFVDDSHFCCVFPTASRGQPDKMCFRLFGLGALPLARWVPSEVLSRHWRGEALLLFPPRDAPSPSRPCMKVSPLLVDWHSTSVTKDGVYEATVQVSNTGREKLLVDSAEVNCFSLLVEPEKLAIAGGGSASIKLTSKETCGCSDLNQVVLTSNDPRKPRTTITVLDPHYRHPWLSRREICFGEIPVGSATQTMIRLRSRSDSDLRVVSATTSPVLRIDNSHSNLRDPFAPSVDQIEVLLSHDETPDSTPQHALHDLSPSDTANIWDERVCEFSVHISVPQTMSAGQYQGQLYINCRDPRPWRAVIPITFTAVPCVYAIPPELAVVPLETGSKETSTIRLRSHSGKLPIVRGCSLIGDIESICTSDISHSVASESESNVQLVLERLPEPVLGNLGSKVVTGDLVVTTDSGECIIPLRVLVRSGS